jgi:hypothetical protein
MSCGAVPDAAQPTKPNTKIDAKMADLNMLKTPCDVVRESSQSNRRATSDPMHFTMHDTHSPHPGCGQTLTSVFARQIDAPFAHTTQELHVDFRARKGCADGNSSNAGDCDSP